MVRGFARMCLVGVGLLVGVLLIVWYAVAGFVAALVSWPGLIVVGLLAVVVARAATKPPTCEPPAGWRRKFLEHVQPKRSVK